MHTSFDKANILYSIKDNAVFISTFCHKSNSIYREVDCEYKLHHKYEKNCKSTFCCCKSKISADGLLALRCKDDPSRDSNQTLSAIRRDVLSQLE